MSEFSANQSQHPYELPEPAGLVARLNSLIRHWNNAPLNNGAVIVNNGTTESRIKFDTAAIGHSRLMPLVEYTGSEAETITQAPAMLLGSLIIARTIERGTDLHKTARAYGLDLSKTRDAAMAAFSQETVPTTDAPQISALDVDVARYIAVGLLEKDSPAAAPAIRAHQAAAYYFDAHPASRA